jgi:hypothetical protein
MFRVNGLDMAKPFPYGLPTWTFAVPGVAMSLDEIKAVNRVSLTNVVGLYAQFHCRGPVHTTVELGTKPEPSIVSTESLPPEARLLGERVVSIGAG